MEYHCGEYLSKYTYRNDIKASYNHHAENAMVIVETRCGYWLPLVIRNALDKLPGWNLYVVGPRRVIDFVVEKVGGTFIPLILDVETMNIPMYNNLLMDVNFWKKIREKHILIFQMDCILLRAPTDAMLSWDYIGAVCGQLTEKRFIMNGGLSLRNRNAMITACGLFSDYERTLPEDVAFTLCMRRYGLFTLPSMVDCNNFAYESLGNGETVIGIHGTDKYYTKNYLSLLK